MKIKTRNPLKRILKTIAKFAFYGIFLLGCFFLMIPMMPSSWYEETHDTGTEITEIEEAHVESNIYPYVIRLDELKKVAKRETKAVQIAFDLNYNFTDLEEWKTLFEKTAEKHTPQKEIFDCENFVLSVITNLAKEGINGAGLVIGDVLIGRFSPQREGHGWVAFIVKTEIGDVAIYYYDAVSNKILGRASEVKNYQAEFIQWY